MAELTFLISIIVSGTIVASASIVSPASIAKMFSSIDLQSAYYQIRLTPEDVPKTAFTTPLGLYEFRVLCFGLTNVPCTFQNIVNDVLQDGIGEFVIAYLDDIVILWSVKLSVSTA